MKKIVLVVLAFVLTLSVVCISYGADAADDGQVYELAFSTSRNEGNIKPLLDAFAYMEEASNGRIKVTPYFSNSLVAQADVPKAFLTGMCDFIDVNPNNFNTIFPLSGHIFGLPLLGISAECSDMFYDLAEEIPQLIEEFDALNMKIFMAEFSQPYNLFIDSSEEIIAPEDLKGKKVMAADLTTSTLIQMCGGAPITLSFPDMYSNIEKGVADGVILHMAALRPTGVLEVVNHITEFGEGYSRGLTIIAMNQETYDSLPADLQAIVDEAMYMFRDAEIADQARIASEAREEALAGGIVISTLTDEQIAPWREMVQQPILDTLKEVDDAGYPGTELYNKILDYIAATK